MFRKLKSIFDLRHLFNPGKIVGPAPGSPAWPRRREVRPAALAATPTEAQPESADKDASNESPVRRQLQWQQNEVAAESFACNGCGSCRTEHSGLRMCPIFHATHEEAATPRAKANLMQYLLHPETDPRLLSSDEVRAVADLCVNCRCGCGDPVPGTRQCAKVDAGSQGGECRRTRARSQRLGDGPHGEFLRHWQCLGAAGQ